MKEGKISAFKGKPRAAESVCGYNYNNRIVRAI